MKLGRIRISGGFLFLLALLNYMDSQRILPAAVCACVMHEGGHYLALRACRCQVEEVILTVCGAEMKLGEMLGYRAELLCAAAGPAVNLLAAVISANLGFSLFAGINLALAIFNLLPLGCMDGGRILRSFLSLTISRQAADRIVYWTDRMLAVLLLALGLVLTGIGGSFTLLITALWLYFNGRGGEIGRKKTCQQTQKRVKLIHAPFRKNREEPHESDIGAYPAQGTKTCSLYGRRI